MATIKLCLDGVDIFDDIELESCVHEMFSSGHADVCTIKLFDSKNLWDKWGVSSDTAVSVEADGTNTGGMELIDICQQRGKMLLRASSCPQDGFRLKQRTWNSVRLMQVISDIASGLGLAVKTYGLSDWPYSELEQNESDYRFLQYRLMIEGCSFVIYDGTLVVYSWEWLSEQDPSQTLTLTTEMKFKQSSAPLYQEAIVECGDFVGRSSLDISGEVLTARITAKASNQLEANRFAKNFLSARNDESCRVICYGAPLGYVPATTIELSSGRSWDGKHVIERVKNDYVNNSAKIMTHRRWT